MNSYDCLTEDIEIGIKAKEFIDSPLGVYVRDYAQQDINECLSHLSDMSADRSQDDLMRQKIAVRRTLFEWLVEAMNAAEAARSQLEQAESED